MREHTRAGRPLMGLVGLTVVATMLAGGAALGALHASKAKSAPSSGAKAPNTPTREGAVTPSLAAPTASATVSATRKSPGKAGTQTTKSPTPATRAPSQAAKPQGGARRVAAAATPSVDAYRGLGAWVDIYDDRAWSNPAAAVRDMAAHGVRTLYVETANSRSPSAVRDKGKLQTFVREAHARKMRIVAWYLADMANLSTDYSRVAWAIRFKTSDGQRMDSFALDIESEAVSSVGARNKALEALSTKIRALVGPGYPLGAIIPAPAAIDHPGSMWYPFPYAMVAQKYDVFVPMSYYTYHQRGYGPVYADTRANLRSLRSHKGAAAKPVHMIGGLSDQSTTAELQAFLRAAREGRSAGASIYAWSTTTSGQWQALKTVKR